MDDLPIAVDDRVPPDALGITGAMLFEAGRRFSPDDVFGIVPYSFCYESMVIGGEVMLYLRTWCSIDGLKNYEDMGKHTDTIKHGDYWGARATRWCRLSRESRRWYETWHLHQEPTKVFYDDDLDLGFYDSIFDRPDEPDDDGEFDDSDHNACEDQ